jgi:lysozyme
MAFPAGAVPGIDVSHYQAVVDWTAVGNGGERFGFAKASEGASVSDKYFADNWSGMKAAGLLRGAYHFYHPNVDPTTQANNFLEHLADANGGSPVLGEGDLPAALDVEVTDGAAPDDLLAGAAAWLKRVESATGKRPILYTYVSFWRNALGNTDELSSYPLWIAHLNVASPTVPGGWSNWIFWQFDKQPVSGVPSAIVDLDAFNGTYADLQALAK